MIRSRSGIPGAGWTFGVLVCVHPGILPWSGRRRPLWGRGQGVLSRGGARQRESRIGPGLPRRAAGLGRFPRRPVLAPQARRLRLRTRILRGDRGFYRDQGGLAGFVPQVLPVVLRHRRSGSSRERVGDRWQRVGTDGGAEALGAAGDGCRETVPERGGGGRRRRLVAGWPQGLGAAQLQQGINCPQQGPLARQLVPAQWLSLGAGVEAQPVHRQSRLECGARLVHLPQRYQAGHRLLDDRPQRGPRRGRAAGPQAVHPPALQPTPVLVAFLRRQFAPQLTGGRPTPLPGQPRLRFAVRLKFPRHRLRRNPIPMPRRIQVGLEPRFLLGAGGVGKRVAVALLRSLEGGDGLREARRLVRGNPRLMEGLGVQHIAGQEEGGHDLRIDRIPRLAAQEADGLELVRRLPAQSAVQQAPQLGPAVQEPLGAGGGGLQVPEQPRRIVGVVGLARAGDAGPVGEAIRHEGRTSGTVGRIGHSCAVVRPGPDRRRQSTRLTLDRISGLGLSVA
jgi:hypothetical protein